MSAAAMLQTEREIMGATGYQQRQAADVTTEDLIATIRNDRDDVATFEARAEYEKRCMASWRAWAPIGCRVWVTDRRDGGRIYWHNFVERGVM
jgi:hypothetical protein